MVKTRNTSYLYFYLVSATRDDRDQLVKEIMTMQNLGCHQQIVSLLGACTKGRTLCLVLEYCPGGDLLTFIRKVSHRQIEYIYKIMFVQYVHIQFIQILLCTLQYKKVAPW